MCTSIRPSVHAKIAGLLLAAIVAGTPDVASAQQVFNSDVVIRNSLAVGFDTPNSPSFSDTTILLMENNTRIKFDDTSTGSFPNRDWTLQANDSASGGANGFFIIDNGVTSQGGSGGTKVFGVAGGAPANSLFVDSAGRIGRKTSTPVLELHIVDGDSPALRLQQDNSSGFTPQTWDIAGNETNFFVRDVTAGSTLPFRIFPGAPSSSLTIGPSQVAMNDAGLNQDVRIEGDTNANLFFTDASTDRIGMGTNAPNSLLHLQTAGTAQIILEGTTAQDVRHTLRPSTGVAEQWSMVVAAGNANVLRLVRGALSNPHLWQINNTGDVTATTFNGVSSRELKQDIRDLDADKAIAALRELTPVEYAYISDPSEAHVGFIAEDVPELVANNDRKSLSSADIVAVVTKVVKEQQATNDAQQATIDAQQATIAELQARLDRIEQLSN